MSATTTKKIFKEGKWYGCKYGLEQAFQVNKSDEGPFRGRAYAGDWWFKNFGKAKLQVWDPGWLRFLDCTIYRDENGDEYTIIKGVRVTPDDESDDYFDIKKLIEKTS